eukprot:g46137.t1
MCRLVRFGSLAFIAQYFEYRSWEVIVEVVQDIGEASSGILCPFLVTSYEKIIKLEQVQKRINSMLFGMEGLRFLKKGLGPKRQPSCSSDAAW